MNDKVYAIIYIFCAVMHFLCFGITDSKKIVNKVLYLIAGILFAVTEIAYMA